MGGYRQWALPVEMDINNKYNKNNKNNNWID